MARRRMLPAPLAFAVAGAVIGLITGTATPSGAAAAGSATGDLPVDTATWSAVAGANGSTPAGGSGFVINWNLTGTLVSQYFQVANTGSTDLVAETYTATNSKPTNGTAPPTIALDACVGAAWNTLLGTCAGTVVRVTASNQTATAATIAIPAGGTLSFRAQPITLPNFPQPYTTTVSVSVSRAQARAAATRSS